jgi:octopine/nopaline transport system permease protein
VFGTEYIALMGFGPEGWGALMLSAALMSVAVAASGFLVGLMFGSAVCWARLSKYASARLLADAYATVLRGVPDLLVIYLLYFGGSSVLSHFAAMFGSQGFVSAPTFATGALAIGCVSGAYQSEVLRGAFLAIHSGQMEAGRAYGMSSSLLLRRIIAPQLVRYAIPGMENVWQLVLKESALISVIGLVELMRQSAVGSGSTHQPFYFYATAALLYLAISSVTSWGFRRVEARAFRGVRRA